MTSPKLYLDEHLSPRLAIQLRQYGFDVISTHEANLLEARDEEQLAHATEEKRAIVTFNHKDFVVLHQKNNRR